MAVTSVVSEPLLYHTDSATLLELVRTFPPNEKRVLIVGHNPGLEQFAIRLAESQSGAADESDHLATATLVVMRLNGNWNGATWGAASIVEWIYPRDLP